MKRGNIWLVNYLIVALLHLGAILTHADDARRWSQWLLVPMLLAWVGTTMPSSRLRTGLTVALLFCWAGDVVPHFVAADISFLVLVGLFWVAQVAFIVTFWPFRARATMWLGLVYLAAVVALAIICRAGAGSLFIPVVIYGLTLAAMATVASGLGLLGALGGALFLVSDALIALGAFAGWQNIDLAIMATYIAALGLLVAATSRACAARMAG